MVKLNFKKSGASGNPVLIIMHGLLGSLDNWQTLSNRFSEKFQVYIVDQRNHGKSPHTDSHSYEKMADDLYGLMKDEQIDKAYLVGHSMGGKTVAAFLTKHADKVIKAISIDMSLKAYPSGHEAIFDALKKLDLNRIESRKDADEQLGKHIREFAVRQFLLKNLDRKDDGSYEWKMNLDVLIKDYPKILREIECTQTIETPFLFIKAERSGYIKDDEIKDIQQYFPNATLKEVKGAGHWVHAEKPDEIYVIVMDFFSGKPSL